MPQQKPTIGQTHTTGKRAELLFEEWLPPEWLARKQTPDVFVDYYVEIVENGEPTGKQLASQIKGTQGKSKNSLKFSAKTKHIRYWLFDCQHPVFLFIIDVGTGAGHWLFAQQYANEQIAKARLEKPGKITLHFRPEDSLGDKGRFQDALKAAEIYVRDLHPGSVDAALVKKRLELETKEPRLAYKIVASEGVQTIHVSPKMPLKLKLELKNDHAAETIKAFEQAIETGSELKLPMDKVRLTGSPLFEDLNGSNSQLVVRCGQDAPGQLMLASADAAKTHPFYLDGTCRFGTKIATFRSMSVDAPLRVIYTLGPASEPENANVALEFIFSIKGWQNRRLLQLPYFDPFLDFLTCVVAEKEFTSELVARGIPLTGGRHRAGRNEQLVKLLELVSWLERCRFIASHFKVNPTLPKLDTISSDQWEVVDDLSAILSGHKRMVPMPNLTAQCAMDVTRESKLQEGIYGCLRFENETPTFGLFGIPLTSPPIHLTFTNVHVIPKPGDHENHQVLEIKGTESTNKLIEYG